MAAPVEGGAAPADPLRDLKAVVMQEHGYKYAYNILLYNMLFVFEVPAIRVYMYIGFWNYMLTSCPAIGVEVIIPCHAHWHGR